ncbi:unnamed protein product [Caenorhabditis angaria]|uniref:Lipid droplet-associated hydrolase n=1 Tax=Caenorhabditis angaria TaxID=860376 RepID=A0A9P1I2X0_9PELO|nr:unnamed protein product [Caenorhabditis angaria]
MSITRHVEWIQVAGKWTKMSIMGKNLSEENLRLPNKKSDDNRIVILMIPGNPGNEAFYAHFGREVLKNLEEKNNENQYLFYTVSSINHVKMPNYLNGTYGHYSNDRFSLEDQVTHKLDFVREHLPRGKEVYIFGHSIGSYMMLRILPNVLHEGFNVKKAVALFPTIQHMAASPNGKRLQTILSTLNTHDWFTKGATFWIDYLPICIKKWLISFNLRNENIPAEIHDATVEILHKDVFRNIVHMSNDELDFVVELDHKLLENRDLVHFYYGKKDGWCPVEHGLSMLELLGENQVTIDEDDCEHAFVISEGDIMARNVIKYFD